MKQVANKRGLSLIEVLIALSILSIIGVAVMGIMVSSLRVRRESQRAVEAQQFAYTVLERHKEYWANVQNYKLDPEYPNNSLPLYVRSEDLASEVAATGFSLDLRYSCLDRHGTVMSGGEDTLNCTIPDPDLRAVTVTLKEGDTQRARLYTEVGRPINGGS